MKSFNLQKGQSLLILVLMMSLVLAVLSAVSYRLTTDTQSAQLQEDAVSALAAADAGIEVGLKIASSAPENTITGPLSFNSTQVSLRNIPGIDSDRSQITIFTSLGNDFETPEIAKDSQFTYYLTDPNNLTTNTTNFSGTVNIFFKSEGNCNVTRTTPALEISVISWATTPKIERYLVEPCTSGDNVGTGTGLTVTDLSRTILDQQFNKRVVLNFPTASTAKVIVVRPFFSNTILGFQVQSTGSIPNQGRTIRSNAVTTSGVSRTIDVFQSLPQLPAEFFVTQL